MRIDRLTEPAALLMTAAGKDHLRYELTDEDAYIDSLIAAATQRAEVYLARALVARDLKLVLDAFPGGADDTIELPHPPCISITSLKYLDSAGALQTLPASSYTTSIPSAPQASRARIAPVTEWPTTQSDTMDTVRVEFKAGYSSSATVPAAIKQAILLIVAALFEHRGDDEEPEIGRAHV